MMHHVVGWLLVVDGGAAKRSSVLACAEKRAETS